MDTFQKLKKQIEPIVSLTDEELAIFTGALVPKKISKNEFFLREGQICDFVGFVNSGVIIYFKSKENGDEITTDFAFEGEWISNTQSRLTKSPSTFSIKASEDSEILLISQNDLDTLYLQIPKIERLGRILMEVAYLKIAAQSMELQVLSARERYENMLKKYPKVFQKVQLYHIANYLGIAPKSLSRIRKEMMG
ncbi:MAG: Crp/Fnr family transcriptional regulator [Bacteroidetes bacterium]|nr:Crp/Fnr family transcriptional regulator [Bacteroidota bacterium]